VTRRVVALWAIATLIGTFGCNEVETPDSPNVFLITVDTLRADRLGAYGSGRALTPGLDRLAAESVVFENAYAPVPYTVPSVSGLLTGRHPFVTGVMGNFDIVPDAVPTLAERLREAGWRTGAVVSNFALRRTSGFNRGFDAYDDQFTQLELNREHPERTAQKTREAALAVFDELKREDVVPVFLWAHFQDPHGPYTPPEYYRDALVEEARSAADGRRSLPMSRTVSGIGGIPDYQQLGDEREVGFYRGSYDAEVAFVDAEISALLEGLQSRGALDNAIVVFASDHGEGLGEDDYWFAHGETLGEPVVRIPLMIRAPGRKSERRRDTASLLDVKPTLLSLLGITMTSSEGRDLFSRSAAEPALVLSTLVGSNPARYALVTGDEKYVVLSSSTGIVERLHRLPDDSTDLSHEQPGRLDELRREFQKIRGTLGRAFKSQRQTVSEVERERLRALGYIEDQ
jgi:arylsulfatase